MHSDELTLKRLDHCINVNVDSCLEMIWRTTEGRPSAKRNGVKRLREDLAHCIREKHRVEQEQRVLNRLHQVIQSRIEANQYQDMNLNKMIAQAMKDGVTDMDEVSLAKSEAMIRFDRKWNSLEQGVSQESMQTSSMEGDDDELMTVSISAITTDPITKKQIKNPVKNSDCGHVYDKDTILELLRSNPNTRCPYQGCANVKQITRDTLIPDEELKKHLAALKKRKKRSTRD